MEIKSIFQIQSVHHSIERWSFKKNKFQKKINDLKFIQNKQLITSRYVKQKIDLKNIFKDVFKKELTLLEKNIKQKISLKDKKLPNRLKKIIKYRFLCQNILK